MIDNLNFEIKSGEFHAFTGTNSAGKTTTIKVIAGAYANFEGQILIDSFDNHIALAKERIDYIPEKAVFPKNMNTFESLFASLFLMIIYSFSQPSITQIIFIYIIYIFGTSVGFSSLFLVFKISQLLMIFTIAALTFLLSGILRFYYLQKSLDHLLDLA